MKIQVLGYDGASVETLNIVGNCEFREPREENGEVVGQGSIYCKELRVRYYFHPDGRYDGPEMEVSIEIPADQVERMKSGDFPEEIQGIIDSMQSDRDIKPLGN